MAMVNVGDRMVLLVVFLTMLQENEREKENHFTP
jgi:hypothetical protein